MYLSFDSLKQHFNLRLSAGYSYVVELGADALGNITRIQNALERVPEKH